MKIGDYVRTIYGIAKIENISCGEDLWFDNDNIIKSAEGTPKGLLSLIEAGDYVNGYKVEYVDTEYGPYGVYIEVPFVDSESIGCNINLIRAEEIKSIVTKEQFEKMEYKI